MKKRFLTVICSLIVICGFGLPFRVYAQNNSIHSLANRYSFALRKFEKQNTGGNIAAVYRKGKIVADKLDELENLSAADYASVEKKMRGFVVNRDEIIFVKPDVGFFMKLSKRRGTKADIAFFKFLGELRPESVWVAYIQQQTDYSGCTIYGKGILTRLYGKAKQFRQQYPSAYVADIKEEIENMKSELTMDTCACGDRNSVIKEFQLFIKTFPADKITPIVRKRLKEVQSRKSAFRFNCMSG